MLNISAPDSIPPLLPSISHFCSLRLLLLADVVSTHGCRYQRSYNYQEVSRTLCPSKATNETGPLEQLIFVDVASMAPHGAHYKLLVTKIKHFQLR